MKHPIARIFAPIGMIIFIATSSVVVAVDEFDVVELQSSSEDVTESIEADADALDSVVARQSMPVRR